MSRIGVCVAICLAAVCMYAQDADDSNLYADTMSIRGSGSSDYVAGTVEWVDPIGTSQFDFGLRGNFLVTKYQERNYYTTTRYTYRYTRRRVYRRAHTQRHYYYEDKHDVVYSMGAFLTWRPFRDAIVSPFVSAGANLTGLGSDRDSVESEMKAVCRCGATVRLGQRMSLTGDFLIDDDYTQLLVDLGFGITETTQLHLITEMSDIDNSDSQTYGAGISFIF